MMFKRLLALSVVCSMVLAACGQAAPTPDAPQDQGGTGQAGAVADGDRDFITFEWYFNYDWFNPLPWGDDLITAHWGEMFNVHVETRAPDATPTEVLNLMIVADNLPDVIWMERDDHNAEMTRLGLFYSIDELVAMVDNNWYHENVPASTQSFYEVDGVNHVIPNWVRAGVIGQLGEATGGNWAWLKTTNLHEAVGSPSFTTFEDLYAYAVAARDAGLTDSGGAAVIPVLFNGGQDYGQDFVNMIYRSFGGATTGWGDWFGIKPDGTFGTRWDNWVWREAVLEANRWHREGLFPATNLTNTPDQFRENLMSGRAALIVHDHSDDNTHSWRRILRENDPGNSIEVIISQQTGDDIFLFPPARGLAHTDINSDTHGTLGWNGSFITRSAEHPGRIFEVLTWMLTPLGSVEMMFGPQGELWDDLTPEGFPILHAFPDALPAAEHERIGIWRWNNHGHSNHVDNAKFAANAAIPEEYRNWVDLMQATLFTPRQRLSDEFQILALTIDSTEPLGINRTMIIDHFEMMLPQVILASTAEEAEALFDSVVDFAFSHGMAEIEERYSAQWEENKARQGGSVFAPHPLTR